MKNALIFIILGGLAVYLWPSPQQEPEPIEPEVTEYVQDEAPIKMQPPKIKDPSPKPSPQKKAIIQPQPKVDLPLAVSSQQSNANNYQTKIPPKKIEFKINKRGEAIAHGDIFLGKVKNAENLKKAQTKPKPVKLWDSVDIPYFINDNVSQKQDIEEVIAFYNQNTNLNFFINDGSFEDSIVFTKGEEHCYSYLGKIGGHQPIYLSNNCGLKEISHEIMHALGYVHEHTRPIRDNYVKINWDKIDPEFHSQFSLVPKEFVAITLAGFPFSYNSIMLYDPKSFAKDKTSTTIQSTSNQVIAPSKYILSNDDIRRINNTY